MTEIEEEIIGVTMTGRGAIGDTNAVPGSTSGILLTTMKMAGIIPDTGALNRERVTRGRSASISRNFTSALGGYSGMDFCGNHYSGGRSLGDISNNASS
jgi:hypothetical protein